MYRPTTQESAWVEARVPSPSAPLCIQAAAAFNRLDADLFASLLAEGCIYESQAVNRPLAGGPQIAEHFAAKFDLLRQAGPAALVSAELAVDPAGRPCVLLHQRDSAYGRPGLGHLSAYLVPTARPDGKAGRLFMMSSVPPPEQCTGSGLFPGIDAATLAANRGHEGGRIPLSAEVVLMLFAMPRVSVCDEMVRSLKETAADFHPATVRVVPSSDKQTCIEHGVSGFPTLIVKQRGETVRTLGGYRTPAQLRDELRDLFAR